MSTTSQTKPKTKTASARGSSAAKSAKPKVVKSTSAGRAPKRGTLSQRQKTVAAKAVLARNKQRSPKAVSARATALTWSDVEVTPSGSAHAIANAVNRVKAMVQPLVAKAQTKTEAQALPKELSDFSGWSTNPSKAERARVQASREFFSVDNS